MTKKEIPVNIQVKSQKKRTNFIVFYVLKVHFSSVLDDNLLPVLSFWLKALH